MIRMIQRDGEPWVRFLPDGEWHKLPPVTDESIAAFAESVVSDVEARRQVGLFSPMTKEQSDE